MTLTIIILSVTQSFALAMIVWLCNRISKANQETMEAIAARQRAEVQLHTTSREFNEYRHAVQMEKLNGF